MQPSSPNNEQGAQNSNPIQPTLEESEVLNLDETNVSPLRQ
ncbi:MAG: hypothetical protein K0S11_1652 [Gammaproteobacteria bacterium]|jgi:hypothetical protein|nr:hypothetical protein [Gammaproteobacteria bacterium]